LDVIFEPSVDLAVMLAEPAFRPVTTPAELTEATVPSLEIQFRILLLALAGVTVAVRGVVAPTVMEAVAGIVTWVTRTVGAAPTVTVQLFDAMCEPSVEAAVISVDPVFRPVTIPVESTEAMVGSPEVQVSVLLAASAGSTVADSVVVEPTFTAEVAGIETLVIQMLTVTRQALDVIFEPSVDVAVISACPDLTPRTVPEASTLAMVASLEDQFSPLLVALAGTTVATSVWLVPTPREYEAGLRLTPVTDPEGGGVSAGVELPELPQAMVRTRPKPQTMA
jgi:hypothetical protein